MGAVQTGTLLIADVTGYSVFLRDSELAHAEQSLSALLGLLVDQTRPPIVVSKSEGDAIFSYLPGASSLRGQAFEETIEACYVAFRRALELMVINTTCACNACANISSLDLKFFVHHGEFVIGSVAGRDELHGPDVNLIHRLLKNTITADTGIGAYALYTTAAIEALGLVSESPHGVTHTAEYPDVGEVTVRVDDLHAVWERWRDAPSVPVDSERIQVEVSTEIRVPPEIVWRYLIDPQYRTILIGSGRQELDLGGEPRAGPGSVFQCYHGDRLTPQVVVEWTPFERMVTRDRAKTPIGTVWFLIEYVLSRTDAGTRLTQAGYAESGPRITKGLVGLMIPTRHRAFQRDLDAFRDRIEELEGIVDAT